MATITTDHLTNLQDALDQLATQMFASLRYISAHHALAPISNQPFHGDPAELAAPRDSTTAAAAASGQQPGQAANHASGAQQATAPSPPTQPTPSQPQPHAHSPTLHEQQQQQQLQQQTQPDEDPNLPPRPDTPRTFAAALEELARDLVTKERQIEALIGTLPGRGRSLEAQEARLQELDSELRGVEGEVARAAEERDELCSRVEAVMWRIGRWK